MQQQQQQQQQQQFNFMCQYGMESLLLLITFNNY